MQLGKKRSRAEIGVEDRIGGSKVARGGSSHTSKGASPPSSSVGPALTSSMSSTSSSSDKKAELRAKLFPSSLKHRVGASTPSIAGSESLLQRALRLREHSRVGSAPDFEVMPVSSVGTHLLRGMGMSESELARLDAPDDSPKKIDAIQSLRARHRRTGRTHPGLGADKVSEAASTTRFDLDDLVSIRSGTYMGKVGIVWQVQGVAGLDRILVRIPPTESTPPTSSSSSSSSTPTMSTKVVPIARRSCVLLRDLGEEVVASHHDTIQLLREEQAVGRREEAKRKEAERAARAREQLQAMSSHSNPSPSPSPSPPTSSQSSTSSATLQERARSAGRGGEGEGVGASSWHRGVPLCPGIVVRIVDPSFAKGRFFRCKGHVVRVHPNGRADLAVEHVGVVANVETSALQTCIPKSPGQAMRILVGSKTGKLAFLISKNKKKETVSAAIATDTSPSVAQRTAEQVAAGAMAIPPGVVIETLPMHSVSQIHQESHRS